MKRDWIAIQNENFRHRLNTNLLEVRDAFDEVEIYDSVSELLFNGKRVRAELIYALSGNDSMSNVDDIALNAAAIELIHLSTLIHDDIIDGASKRRNTNTVNSLYSDNVSILVGNIIKDKALAIVPESTIGILNEASFDVNRGQILETLAREYSVLSTNDYFKVVLFKSVMMFIHCARIANTSRKEPVREEDFRSLALVAFAYQIIDDWIDVAKTKTYSGKDAGLDLANEVKSFFSSSPNGEDKISLVQVKDLHLEILADITKLYTQAITIDTNMEFKTNIDLFRHDSGLIYIFLNELRQYSLHLVKNDDVKNIVIHLFDHLKTDISYLEKC